MFHSKLVSQNPKNVSKKIQSYILIHGFLALCNISIITRRDGILAQPPDCN